MRETKEGLAALLDLTMQELAEKGARAPREFVLDLPAGAVLRLKGGGALMHLGGGRFASSGMVGTLEGSVVRGSPEDMAWPERFEQTVRDAAAGPWRAVVSAPRVTRALAEEVGRTSGCPVSEATLAAVERLDAEMSAAEARAGGAAR